MREVIGQEKCAILREGTVIEDQEELGPVGSKALQGVREARREIPQIPFL